MGILLSYFWAIVLISAVISIFKDFGSILPARTMTVKVMWKSSNYDLGTKRMQRSQTFWLHGQVQIVEVYFKKPRQQKPTFDQEMQTQVQKG